MRVKSERDASETCTRRGAPVCTLGEQALARPAVGLQREDLKVNDTVVPLEFNMPSFTYRRALPGQYSNYSYNREIS